MLVVSYNANMDQVEEVVNRIGNDMASDPDWKGSIITPPRFLRIDDFADSSIIIKIVGDTQPLKQWVIAREIPHSHQADPMDSIGVIFAAWFGHRIDDQLFKRMMAGIILLSVGGFVLLGKKPLARILRIGCFLGDGIGDRIYFNDRQSGWRIF
ncbi:MAG: mechanosensitive ion channel family protein [Saprospiraceae bacterium]|nr:mechanosensitive ion channel family protein [Saprospiraceae bacterium]